MEYETVSNIHSDVVTVERSCGFLHSLCLVCFANERTDRHMKVGNEFVRVAPNAIVRNPGVMI